MRLSVAFLADDDANIILEPGQHFGGAIVRCIHVDEQIELWNCAPHGEHVRGLFGDDLFLVVCADAQGDSAGRG